MKTTTLPPMKVGKNQTLLPSGVKASNDGKYHYWQCSVSGLETFAKPDYWVKIMAKYKTEANLVKTYVCKKAKALLDAGLTQAEIIKKLSQPANSEDRQARKEQKEEKVRRKQLVKKTRKKSLKGFAVGKEEIIVQDSTGSVVKEVIPVYPWQKDPNYFKSSGTAPLDIEEMSKDVCAFPNRYLDDECRNCPIYDRCQMPEKFTEDDWKKPRKNKGPIVKQIDMSDFTS